MICKECEEEVDELTTVRVAGKNRSVCEECAEILQQEEQLAEEAESAMQGMMEYKGR